MAKPALTYGHKKSADLPYFLPGPLQPLYIYGEIYAYAQLQSCIDLLDKIPYEVVVRQEN